MPSPSGSCRINKSDPAAIAGGYSSWTTPYSYIMVRKMQQDIGLLGNGSCLRTGQVEELIHCEAGQIKLPPHQLNDRCLELNLTCPDVSFKRTTQALPYQLTRWTGTLQLCGVFRHNRTLLVPVSATHETCPGLAWPACLCLLGHLSTFMACLG